MEEKNNDAVPPYGDDADYERLESDLREARCRYQQLIDDLPDGYAEFDLQGNLTRFNKALVAMYSRGEDELRNLSYKAFLDKEASVRVRREYDNVCQTGLSSNVHVYEIIRKDGKRMIVEGSIALKKVDGKVVGFRGVWRDITERRRTERALAEHQRHLEAIFTSVNEAIMAFDADGRLINSNRAVETICGTAADTLIGNPFAEIRTGCGHACHTLLQESLTGDAEIKERQIECRRNERPQQVVVANCSPLMDTNGKSMGAVLVVRDITELLGLEKELIGRYRFQNLIGKSKKMQEIYDLLESLASLETTVLITGESGTGKELVARALHYAGERAKRPFVKVNCSALTENLLESELFGHAKGAFTGAIKDRPGRFEIAEGGTILLDEVGDLSPLTQLKLLRVLQDKEVERVGESSPRKVNVRVIAATNKDLKQKVKTGEYREDLYYRLKVMEITLPPLRERREDLPLLVHHFCRLYGQRFKKGIKGVSDEVMRLFMEYAWPGNVRELEHGLERAFVLCNGRTLEPGHLPAEILDYTWTAPATPRLKTGDSPSATHEVLQALKNCRWNKTRAAALLGIDRRTLYRRIERYHLLEE